jgi:electron transfer flavoprotein beta subunit
MTYRAAVCVKPVPDPNYYGKVGIDPVKKTITRAGIPNIFNPPDKNALEAVLRLRESGAGSGAAGSAYVAAISMSPPEGAEILREALAMGADEAYLLCDMAFAGADTLATSYTIYHGLKKIEAEKGEPFDLIFCGAESADGATAQVSSQLGEWFGYPQLWNVFHLEESGGIFKLKTKLENGYMEWEAKPPLVLGVARELNKPRFISAMGVVKSRKKPLVTWGRPDLTGADDGYLGLAGSPTKAGAIFTPDLRREGRRISGSPDEITAELLSAIRASGAVAGM